MTGSHSLFPTNDCIILGFPISFPYSTASSQISKLSYLFSMPKSCSIHKWKESKTFLLKLNKIKFLSLCGMPILFAIEFLFKHQISFQLPSGMFSQIASGRWDGPSLWASTQFHYNTTSLLCYTGLSCLDFLYLEGRGHTLFAILFVIINPAPGDCKGSANVCWIKLTQRVIRWIGMMELEREEHVNGNHLVVMWGS